MRHLERPGKEMGSLYFDHYTLYVAHTVMACFQYFVALYFHQVTLCSNRLLASRFYKSSRGRKQMLP